MIVAKSISKTFGLNPVLRGVDLTIPDGQFALLVGANGAGKTTLLRIMATLLSPNSGEMTIGGWPLSTHAGRVRQHIGYLSHQSLLYGDLSAEENLRFFADVYGVSDAETLIDDQLKRFGLHWRRGDLVRTFSRGMTQRLALARSTLHNPDVLLLDEPYTGLDQKSIEVLDTLLKEQHAAGRTIVMITHDILHGAQLTERILMLQKGKIVQDLEATALTEAELLAHYREVLGR